MTHLIRDKAVYRSTLWYTETHNNLDVLTLSARCLNTEIQMIFIAFGVSLVSNLIRWSRSLDLFCHVSVKRNRPTQWMMYLHFRVVRFQEIILLIIHHKYLNVVKRIRCSEISSSEQDYAVLEFITQHCWVVYLCLTKMVRWKWFVRVKHQLQRANRRGWPLVGLALEYVDTIQRVGRPIRLRLKIRTRWQSKCNRLYLNMPPASTHPVSIWRNCADCDEHKPQTWMRHAIDVNTSGCRLYSGTRKPLNQIKSLECRWHDGSICATWHIHACGVNNVWDMTRSHVAWCDVMLSNVWHQMCRLRPLNMWHERVHMQAWTDKPYTSSNQMDIHYTCRCDYQSLFKHNTHAQ